MDNLKFKSLNHLVVVAILCSISIVLSVLENMLVINFILPGLKLGLSNIIIILLIRKLDFRDLLMIQIVKVVITAFILGLFSTFIFSIVASIVALLVTYFISKVKIINVASLCVISAVAHNITQVFVAVFYLNSISIINYLPLIIVFGLIMGNITGFICLKLFEIFDKEIDDFI